MIEMSTSHLSRVLSDGACCRSHAGHHVRLLSRHSVSIPIRVSHGRGRCGREERGKLSGSPTGMLPGHGYGSRAQALSQPSAKWGAGQVGTRRHAGPA